MKLLDTNKMNQAEELQDIADKFNQQYPVGTLVTRYKLIDPLREPQTTRTTSAAWVMGGHSVMIKVDGVSGGVLLESIEVFTDSSDLNRAEKEWIKQISKLLCNPPTDRLGLYTIGDPQLHVYDLTKEPQIDKAMDERNMDFCTAADETGASLGCISASVNIHSTAG